MISIYSPQKKRLLIGKQCPLHGEFPVTFLSGARHGGDLLGEGQPSVRHHHTQTDPHTLGNGGIGDPEILRRITNLRNQRQGRGKGF